jgi:Uma2 family endonuclease
VAAGRAAQTSLDTGRVRVHGSGGPDERVELIQGEIFEMSPMNPRHANSMRRVARVLQCAFGEGFVLSNQLPLLVGDHSELLPDFTVCRGELDDFDDSHPTAWELVVEVADSSLRLDRGRKASLYAAANVPEVWIIDLVRGRVGVRCEPMVAADGTWEYGINAIHLPGHTFSPLCQPDVSIAASDLLPRAKEQTP